MRGRKIDPSIRIDLTAVHEAGHATVAHLLGLTVSQVEILGGPAELGSCHTLRLPEGGPIAREHALEDALLVAVAGVVAESLATGAADWDEDSHDLDHAVRLALELTGDCEAAHALLLRTGRRVRRALAHHWESVTLLAQELERVRRLSGQEVDAILEDALVREGHSRARTPDR